MRKARAELGEDARLVSARRVSPPNALPQYEVEVLAGRSRASSAPIAPTGGLDALRREIESLRESLLELRAGTGEEAEPAATAAPRPADGRCLDLLRRRGVGQVLAERLAGRVARRVPDGADEDALAALRDVVAAELAPADGNEEPIGERSTLVVGPSGAGKTTVVAKIAAELVSRGRTPVLVAADGESLAGEDTLDAVATALGLPFETAFVDGRLSALAERSPAGTVLLVDPPGRTPFERDGLEALRPLVDAVPDLEVVPVIPATTDLEEARLLVEGYLPLGVRRVVLTKLDELARPGRLVDLAAALGRPVAWVTYGRSARGAGSAPADPRVVSRILGTRLAVQASA